MFKINIQIVLTDVIMTWLVMILVEIIIVAFNFVAGRKILKRWSRLEDMFF